MEENKASRAFLVTAVVLGLLATVLSFAYLQSRAGRDTGPKVMIEVASHDLKANTPLDPEKDLADFEIPANMTTLRMGAIKPEEKDAYRGMRINRDIIKNTPIMEADMLSAGLPELTKDSRALSIPVHGASGLSGLLIPGNYVKLLVTQPLLRPRAGVVAPGDPANSPRWDTQMVLPDPVKVLAVGGRVTMSPGITMNDEMNRAESAQSVTLEVTEDQAKLILAQTDAGQLPVYLLLCPKPAAAGK